MAYLILSTATAGQTVKQLPHWRQWFCPI